LRTGKEVRQKEGGEVRQKEGREVRQEEERRTLEESDKEHERGVCVWGGKNGGMRKCSLTLSFSPSSSPLFLSLVLSSLPLSSLSSLSIQGPRSIKGRSRPGYRTRTQSLNDATFRRDRAVTGNNEAFQPE
jgi:hypothetical protein